MPAKSSAKAPPKVVKLDRALKLAESWVSKMSPSTPDEPEEPKVEARHLRLGLGAKAPPHVKAAVSTDPIERKLFQKVNLKKRKSSPDTIKTSRAEENDASNDETDEPESRTSAFVKKPATSLSSSSLGSLFPLLKEALLVAAGWVIDPKGPPRPADVPYSSTAAAASLSLLLRSVSSSNCFMSSSIQSRNPADRLSASRRQVSAAACAAIAVADLVHVHI